MTELIKCSVGVLSIKILNGVTSIGDCAFECCSSLESINVDKDNKYYTSVSGILYNKDMSKETEFMKWKEEIITLKALKNLRKQRKLEKKYNQEFDECVCNIF